MSSDSINPYNILNITPKSSIGDCRSAYRNWPLIQIELSEEMLV